MSEITSAFTHARLSKRYLIDGVLVLHTGLHIGTGKVAMHTDSPIIRTAQNEPYIPGSSLKGALRSTVERLVPSVQALVPLATSCQLSDQNDTACLTVSQVLRQTLQQLQEDCDTARRTGTSYTAVATAEQVAELLQTHVCSAGEAAQPSFARNLPYRFIEQHLCDTCKIFGSQWFAAKVRLGDALPHGPWVEMTELRDGVGIDRDTETAKARIKFDLEVIPAQTEFSFRLEAENLTTRELGLLCIGIQELRAGLVPIGGMSSRGLGSCQLVVTELYDADLNDVTALIQYLTADRDAGRMQARDPETFLRERIHEMLNDGGNPC